MPDTRPGIRFNEEGICYPCLHHDLKQKKDWAQRWKELEALADKYRGCNGDYYDCIITASGGKDSHYQAYIFKEKLGMNPLLVSVDNVSWTQTGRMNWDNIRSRFGLDAHVVSLSPRTCRNMFRKAFEKLGSPTWYFDLAIYAYPLQVAIKLGIPLIVYGENTNYERGGTCRRYLQRPQPDQ
jgi:tRNA(Ile)-lysidine synthase TilS/MesJ